MPKLYLEKTVKLEEGKKLYFVSFLRRDFVERSAVITLDGMGRVAHLYLSSYRHGSVEWENGSGLSECRLWETEEQAQEPTYLTRRYTARLSDGESDSGYAAATILPDVLDNMADGEVASLLKDIITRERSDINAGASMIRFKKRPRREEQRVDDARTSISLDIPEDPRNVESRERFPGSSFISKIFSILAGTGGMIRNALKRIPLSSRPVIPDEGTQQAGGTAVNRGDDKSVRERAEEGKRAARRVAGKKKR